MCLLLSLLSNMEGAKTGSKTVFLQQLASFQEVGAASRILPLAPLAHPGPTSDQTASHYGIAP